MDSDRNSFSLQLVAMALVAFCFCGALGIVYSKHLSRQRYIELSQIQFLIDDLDSEWSRLQIEESTFSRHGLIETVARQRLDMVFPEGESIVVISRQ